MKYKYVLPLFCATLLMACENSKLKEDAGILTENMDTTVQPGNDFFEFACGGWMKNHPLTDEYARFGSFDELIENNNKQIHELIQGLAEKKYDEGSLEQKIGDLYAVVMDSTKQNMEGCKPITPMWDEIKAIQTREEIFPLMMNYYTRGIGALMACGFDADITNSSQNILLIMQSGLKMGNPGYYLDSDANSVKIREAYKKMIVNMFKLAGVDEATAKAKMGVIMRMETRMAKKSYTPTQLRDVEKNFNKMSIDKFFADYKGVDWKAAFNAMGFKNITELSVNQKEPIQEAVAMLQQEPVEDLKTYMEWSLLNSSAKFLGDNFYDENFQFYGKTINGQNAKRPRWKIAVSTVEGVIGEGLGKLYVEKYFPAAAKERMEKLVKNLQTALAERIQAQDWMSEETKKVALDKLNAFYVKVGYPNKWTDYSTLTITDDSYWNNVLRSNIFDWNDMLLHKMNQPVDRDEWYMNPQTVNAYYNPTTNEICFPAGILQYPFFDMNADDAFNYGAIGVVIGHEMTHGFDDQGRQFDKEGNFKNWWQEEDAKRFDERAKQLITFFDSIKVLPDLNANGALTIGENIADHGGLMVAYQAYKNATKDQEPVEKKGYTPDQRFFIAYANVWANNIREEAMRQRTKTDSHSLGRWRVNGTLPHIDAWYKAFNIAPTDSLYLPEDQRIKIW